MVIAMSRNQRYERVPSDEPQYVDRDNQFFKFMEQKRQQQRVKNFSNKLLKDTFPLSYKPVYKNQQGELISTLDTINKYMKEKAGLEDTASVIEQQITEIQKMKLSNYFYFLGPFAPIVFLVFDYMLKRQQKSLFEEWQVTKKTISALDSKFKNAWQKKYSNTTAPDDIPNTQASLIRVFEQMKTIVTQSSDKELQELFKIFISNKSIENLYNLYQHINQSENDDISILATILNRLYTDYIDNIDKSNSIKSTLHENLQAVSHHSVVTNFINSSTEENLRLLYDFIISKPEDIDPRDLNTLKDNLTELYPVKMNQLKNEQYLIISDISKSKLRSILDQDFEIKSKHPVMLKLFVFLIKPTWANLEILEQAMVDSPDYNDDKEAQLLVSEMIKTIMPDSPRESNTPRTLQSESFFKPHTTDTATLAETIKKEINVYNIKLDPESTNEARWDAIRHIAKMTLEYMITVAPIISKDNRQSLDMIVSFLEILPDIKNKTPSQSDLVQLEGQIEQFEVADPVRVAMQCILKNYKHTKEYLAVDTSLAKMNLTTELAEINQSYLKNINKPKQQKSPSLIAWNSANSIKQLIENYSKSLEAHASTGSSEELRLIKFVEENLKQMHRILRYAKAESSILPEVSTKLAENIRNLGNHPVAAAAQRMEELLMETEDYSLAKVTQPKIK